MNRQPLTQEKSGLTRAEWNRLKKLSTPAKIQNFLNSLLFNFEKEGETHYSVREALKARTANCFEGALIAALALWMQGREPIILDLKTARPDLDHVVTLFKEGRYWGAISKTNHGVLRYREPIYRDVRELVMSYFHEYFLKNGKKTLRSYSKPFDLRKFAPDWIISDESLAWLAHLLDKSPHIHILTPKQVRNLRKADKVEIEAGEIKEFNAYQR